MNKKNTIKVYHGFGHTHDIVLYGHVFKKSLPVYRKYFTNPLINTIRLLRLFFIKPVPDIRLQVKWDQQLIPTQTAYDGFFRAEWVSARETTAGWHDVSVTSPLDNSRGLGKIFIPHRTQFAFISDIDDTVLVSHSATKGKRLKELLFNNPRTRTIFPGVAEHYRLLSTAHTTPEAPNPFFYVSSSEWNLYDYLRELFEHQQLPNGAFLLSQAKRWYELWKTGQTKHEGKLLRILRILEVFPQQRFVLLGDSSQSDPAIYSKLCEKYSDRIHAVYIRNVSSKNEQATQTLLASLEEKGIATCLFRNSNEAMEHSRKLGLL